MTQIMENANQQSQSNAVAEIISHQKSNGHQVFEFEDNRKETAAQRKLQNTMEEKNHQNNNFTDARNKGTQIINAPQQPYASPAVIQRAVDNFDSYGIYMLGPYNSLYKGLCENIVDFDNYSRMDIRRSLDLWGLNYHRNNVFRTAEVRADNINTSRPNGAPSRSSSETALIGSFAKDFLQLNRNVEERFEGGHLIAHALWDKQDDNVELADSAENVVGMSRNMNIGIYKKIEDVLMSGEDVRNVKIKVDYGPPLQKTVEEWGEHLFIPIDEDYREEAQEDKVSVNNWVPESITLTRSTAKKRRMSPITTEEPARTKPFSDLIDTPYELQTVLESHGIWDWIDFDLKMKILFGHL